MLSFNEIVGYGIINLSNLIILIVLFLRPTYWKMFFFMTTLSFWANVLYFISSFYIEIKQGNNKCYGRKYLLFLRNNYFKISTTYSLFVVVCYWLLRLLGNSFVNTPTTFLRSFFNIYLHGIEFIFVLYDFFRFKREFKQSYLMDVTVILIIYLIYSVMIIFSFIYLDYYPYLFLKNSNINQIIVSYIIFLIILMNCYMLYQYMLSLCFDKSNNKYELKKNKV